MFENNLYLLLIPIMELLLLLLYNCGVTVGVRGHTTGGGAADMFFFKFYIYIYFFYFSLSDIFPATTLITVTPILTPTNNEQ